MTTIELKGNILDIVARFKSAQLLEKLYETATELLEKEEAEEDWWDELNSEEQIRLEQSIKESYDKTNWIDHSVIQQKHSRWLKK